MRRGLDHALDEYLVLLAQGGSREAFARMAARRTPKLLAIAARKCADVLRGKYRNARIAESAEAMSGAAANAFPAGTVKSRLFAARKALRDVFGEDHVKS